MTQQATQDTSLRASLDALVAHPDFNWDYEEVATVPPPFTVDWARVSYLCTFTYQGRTMSVYFFTGGLRKITAQDVLGDILDGCWSLRAHSSPYEWMHEMGVDVEKAGTYLRYWRVMHLHRTALIHLLGQGLYRRLMHAEFDL